MATNKSTMEPVGKSAFLVRVNDKNVFQFGDEQRAAKMVERLNRVFSDTDRDLDFLTPSILQRKEKKEDIYYGIICPAVRRGEGVTHFHPLGERNALNRHIYPAAEWVESEDPKKHTAILELQSQDSPAPWVMALTIANNIRRAIELHFPDASGKRKNPTRCYPLHFPPNRSENVERVIAETAYCAVYAHPCQGRGKGSRSPKCPTLAFPPENILNPYTAYADSEDGFEILHGQDLTCAITSSRGWYNKYKNRFLRVTNLATNQSVVVRVTDQAPRGRGVELTYAAWNAIGGPRQYNSVKIELLGT